MKIMLLRDMLTSLRGEAGVSPNLAHGAHLNAAHTTLLSRVQDEVLAAYEWPLLAHHGDVDMDPGQRFGLYPDALEFETIEHVHARHPGGRWHQLAPGIGMAELNDVDSDAGETRGGLPRRWAHHAAFGAQGVTQNEFQVWPVSSTWITVRFEGQRKALPLVDLDTDYCTVDGPIIVLHAAAELLAAQKSGDAEIKMAKAQSRYRNLRERMNAVDNRRVNMARRPGRGPRPGLDYIP